MNSAFEAEKNRLHELHRNEFPDYKYTPKPRRQRSNHRIAAFSKLVFEPKLVAMPNVGSSALVKRCNTTEIIELFAEESQIAATSPSTSHISVDHLIDTWLTEPYNSQSSFIWPGFPSKQSDIFLPGNN